MCTSKTAGMNMHTSLTLPQTCSTLRVESPLLRAREVCLLTFVVLRGSLYSLLSSDFILCVRRLFVLQWVGSWHALWAKYQFSKRLLTTTRQIFISSFLCSWGQCEGNIFWHCSQITEQGSVWVACFGFSAVFQQYASIVSDVCVYGGVGVCVHRCYPVFHHVAICKRLRLISACSFASSLLF